MSEVTIKYMTCGKYAEIERVQIDRETYASVWINGHKSMKRSEWRNYFDSWDAAKAHLVANAELDVTRASGVLQQANSLLKIVTEYTNPEVQS